jgi:hypothetical protein
MAHGPRKLAGELKAFKTPKGESVGPGNVRLEDGRTPKGYYAEQFADAWARYLDAPIGRHKRHKRHKRHSQQTPCLRLCRPWRLWRLWRIPKRGTARMTWTGPRPSSERTSLGPWRSESHEGGRRHQGSPLRF